MALFDKDTIQNLIKKCEVSPGTFSQFKGVGVIDPSYLATYIKELKDLLKLKEEKLTDNQKNEAKEKYQKLSRGLMTNAYENYLKKDNQDPNAPTKSKAAFMQNYINALDTCSDSVISKNDWKKLYELAQQEHVSATFEELEAKVEHDIAVRKELLNRSTSTAAEFLRVKELMDSLETKGKKYASEKEFDQDIEALTNERNTIQQAIHVQTEKMNNLQSQHDQLKKEEDALYKKYQELEQFDYLNGDVDEFTGISKHRAVLDSYYPLLHKLKRSLTLYKDYVQAIETLENSKYSEGNTINELNFLETYESMKTLITESFPEFEEAFETYDFDTITKKIPEQLEADDKLFQSRDFEKDKQERDRYLKESGEKAKQARPVLIGIQSHKSIIEIKTRELNQIQEKLNRYTYVKENFETIKTSIRNYRALSKEVAALEKREGISMNEHLPEDTIRKKAQALLDDLNRKTKKGHQNSKEFSDMVNALTLVTNFDLKNLKDYQSRFSNTIQGMRSALDYLDTKTKAYLDAKNEQLRPFASSMRQQRLAVAEAIRTLATEGRTSLSLIEKIQKANNTTTDLEIIANDHNKFVQSSKRISNPQNVNAIDTILL